MIAASSSSGSGVTSEGLSTTQQPAATPYTMETFLDRARQLGCDGVSLESCFFPEFGETYLTTLRRRLDALEFDRVYAWGHPDGLEAGGSVKAKVEPSEHVCCPDQD